MDVNRLQRRFLAWWEGIDEGDLGPVAPDDAVGEEELPGPVLPAQPYTPRMPKLSAHLLIAQELWGEGYLGPGDLDFVLTLLAQMGVSRDKSLAVIGIGLGGPARDLCRESGVWVSGYEQRGDLIETASEQCLMAGLARKVTVQLFDPGRAELPVGKYHIIMCRDELHAMPDKATILKIMYEALRPGGSVLVTDYVASGDADAETLGQSAFSEFWGGARIDTADTYSRLIREAGFELRVKKDMTEEYVDLISASTPGWGRLMAMFQAGDSRIADRQEFADALAREAEMWAVRQRALQEGDLAVYRMFGLKPDEVR